MEKILGKTEKIYSELKKSILNNAMKSGSPLSENEIAKMHKVSRSPVREAIRMLEKERLVDIIPKRGAIVSTLRHKDVSDIYEVRLIIESLAARTSLAFIMDYELDELEARWLDIKDRKIDNEEEFWGDILSLNSETHRCFTRKAPNPWVRHLLSILEFQVIRMQNLSIHSLGQIDETVNQHLEIIRAAKTRDVEKYIETLSDHIKKSEQYILQAIELK